MAVLLSVQGLTKSYGVRPLFTELTFDLSANERVGLIGPNGAGKSTLLKILAGKEELDSGTRSLRRATKMGFVAQDDVFPQGLSVQDIIRARLDSESLEDHEKETRISKVLTRTGFDDFDKPAHLLSGGWRKRLGIAREMALDPDLLLLDEPTNHLDIPGIVWLQKLLRASPFGYLVATHDRAFLRGVADEILEINRVYPGGFYRAPGNYDQFLEHREIFLDGQARMQESVANQVRRETEWLGRKAAARTCKATSRIDEAAKRRGELKELQYRTADSGSAGLDFVGTGRQTRKLMNAIGIAKSFPGRDLFSGIDIQLSPGTKLGLLGPNGSGKSVLLKVLSGEHKPDVGVVTEAEGLRKVIFEQGRTALDHNVTLRKALCPNGDMVAYRDRQIHVVAWAKQFLFKVEQLDVLVGALSGGEQARLRMAQMMQQPADLLFLDEPTNDLDIPALEVLEDTLSDFTGALVIVSHDRELLDRICTGVIGLDGRGGSAMYATVQQWLNVFEKAAAKEQKLSSKNTGNTTVNSSAKSAPSNAKRKKLSFAEQQEYDQMEAKVMVAEEKIIVLHDEVEKSATAGHLILTNACNALEKAQKEIELLYNRWQELEQKLDSKS